VECLLVCFFFQAEDGIRAFHVTGVQTCALPIWGVRHRCRASCREGSCCPGSPSRRARMVTGTPLDRHEDKETSGALLDIDGARIASTRSAAGGQTYARPGPGGRAGPPPLVLGRAASSPSYKKGAALDRFGPVPTP